MKKQLIKGALAAVLGLSMVGGGTYAAFNDVEQTSASLAAGTLNLAVNPTVVFDVDNLKPGDWMERNFKITNTGSLDIEKVLMHTSVKVKNKQGKLVTDENEIKEFSDQFNMYLLTTDGQRLLFDGFIFDGIYGKELSIAKLVELTKQNKSIDITTFLEEVFGLGILKPGLPTSDTDHIKMGIEFKDKNERMQDSRLYKQNKFQGYTLEVTYDLEATQFAGERK